MPNEQASDHRAGASRPVPAFGTLVAVVSAAAQREGEHRRRRLSEEGRRGQIIRGCVDLLLAAIRRPEDPR